MRSVLRRRNRFISARSLFARKYFLPAAPTSPNRNAISRSFIIHGAITSGLQNFIALHSRFGRKRRPSRQRNTKSWRRITPIFFVHSVRPAKRTHSKTGPARNDAVDCGCAGCADKSASLRQFFELTWRNWQTRTAQDRMGQPVEVRVLSRAVTLVVQPTLRSTSNCPMLVATAVAYFEPAFLLAAQRAFI